MPTINEILDPDWDEPYTEDDTADEVQDDFGRNILTKGVDKAEDL